MRQKGRPKPSAGDLKPHMKEKIFIQTAKGRWVQRPREVASPLEDSRSKWMNPCEELWEQTLPGDPKPARRASLWPRVYNCRSWGVSCNENEGPPPSVPPAQHSTATSPVLGQPRQATARRPAQERTSSERRATKSHYNTHVGTAMARQAPVSHPEQSLCVAGRGCLALVPPGLLA